jgi:magnesium chelatase subunit I
VDLLLDVAQSGENVVEREGLSIRHAARFVLVGSGNPEEGELRPQLMDRFGLSVDVLSSTDIDERIEVMKRRDAYENDHEAFIAHWQSEDATLRARIVAARAALADLQTPDSARRRVAELCIALGSDGLRGELTLLKAARAFAAFAGDVAVTDDHIRKTAVLALRHRLRRDPLDDSGSSSRVARTVSEILGD